MFCQGKSKKFWGDFFTAQKEAVAQGYKPVQQPSFLAGKNGTNKDIGSTEMVLVFSIGT